MEASQSTQGLVGMGHPVHPSKMETETKTETGTETGTDRAKIQEDRGRPTNSARAISEIIRFPMAGQ